MNPYIHTVQYYETDQMKIVHHSNYIRWFEEARLDWFQQIGFPYDYLESQNIISPVTSVSCDYLAMTRYGERVVIVVQVIKFDGLRLHFEYQIWDETMSQQKVKGTSCHCFIDETGKVIHLKRNHSLIYQEISQKLNRVKEG